MSKSMALVQIVMVLLLVIYSTYQFYRGSFELAFSVLPLLMVYYVFVVGRSRRRDPPADRQDPPGDDTGS